jgi:hypothetical protein
MQPVLVGVSDATTVPPLFLGRLLTQTTPRPDIRSHSRSTIPSHNLDLNKIITPYKVEAFRRYMDLFDLSDSYPNLLDSLSLGFKMGDFAPLTHTVTPPNHTTDPVHIDFLRAYCLDEVAKGRMSGPFSKTQMGEYFGEPFRTSPFGVVEKAGSPGNLRAVQNLSFRGTEILSVNDQIDAEDFQTSWGTAAEIADIVSPFPFSLPFLPPAQLYCCAPFSIRVAAPHSWVSPMLLLATLHSRQATASTNLC